MQLKLFRMSTFSGEFQNDICRQKMVVLKFCIKGVDIKNVNMITYGDKLESIKYLEHDLMKILLSNPYITGLERFSVADILATPLCSLG